MGRSQRGTPDPTWEVQAGFLEEEELFKLKPVFSGSPPGERERSVPSRTGPCAQDSRLLWMVPEFSHLPRRSPAPAPMPSQPLSCHAMRGPMMPALLSFPPQAGPSFPASAGKRACSPQPFLGPELGEWGWGGALEVL